MSKLFILSLVVSVFGVLILLALAYSSAPIRVSSYQDLKLNNFVQTTGKIISANSFNDFSIINLDNNITITCNCNISEGTINVSGKVSEYRKELQINADEIKNA